MRSTKLLVAGLLSLFAVGGTADAATYIYANNSAASGNMVFAFSANSDGSLTPIDVFDTGGIGSVGLFAANRIVAVPSRQLLYVANDASGTISAFSISPATGRLTPRGVFSIGAGAGGDVSLDATPDGAFLFASNSGTNTIVTFAIASNGALTQVRTTQAVGSGVNGLRVSPNGRFLAHAETFTNTVATYLINTNGMLTFVSQVSAGGGGRVASVAFNSQSTLLFGGEAVGSGTTVAAFSVSSTAVLGAVPGSPFIGPGSNSNVALVSPDDRFVFVSNQFSDSVTVFSVGSNGALTLVPGSPFSESSGGQEPSGMVVNSAGTFLYTANVPNTIGGFAINADGTLTRLFVIPVGQGPGLESLTIVDFADATTATSVTSSLNPSQFSQSVTLTATVTSGGSSVTTGTVTFKDGGFAITGPITLDGSGQASFSTSSLSVGEHPITAEYSGALGLAASLGSLAQAVTKADTSTAVTSSANPSVAGQAVTFVATVTRGSQPVTAGSVIFKEAEIVVGGPFPLNGQGQATLSLSTLTVSSHTLTAEYSGSANFNPSTGSLTQMVNKADTTTTVASSANPSAFGQAVTFTATVSSAAGALTGTLTPTGTVQFQVDGVNSGSPVALAGGSAAFTTSILTTGAPTITVIYSSDANFNSSTGTVAQTVNKADTTTTIASSANPSVFGQAVTFTATVRSTAGTVAGSVTPTGSVQFQVDGVNSGSPVALVSGKASFTTSSLTVGPHTITASYSGDASFNVSTGSLTQTVNKADTTTTVASSANPSVFGQAVTFTATVSAATGTPTGSVQFQVDGVNSGSPVVLVSGKASFTTSSLTVGPHTITASYSGDASFNVSTGSLTQTVNKAETTTTVASSLNPSAFGQAVTFTATVSAATGTPTGSVQFQIDGVNSGSPVALVSGKASFTTSSLNVGPHTITASYSGDASFNLSAGSLTQTVNKAETTTTVTSSLSPSAFGQAVTFTATVSAVSGTPSGSVQFQVDGVNSGSPIALVSGKASFTTSSLTVGPHTITASYSGDASFNVSSGSMTQTVNKADTTTTVASSANPSVFGQAVTFTATVSAGTGTPTGSIQFQIDGVNSGGPVPLLSGEASFTTSSLPAGAHTITASYSGDASFNVSSGSLTQTVNKAETTTTVTSSLSPSAFGQAFTFTAMVSAVSGTPSGSVQFQIDGVNSGGPVPLVSGKASFNTSSLPAGAHTITALYGGDANFKASTGSVAQTVTKADTTTTVTSSPNPSTFRQAVTFTVVVISTAGVPSGSVQCGGTRVPLDNGRASFSISSLTPGAHTITCTYSGDANFNVSSGSLAHTVNKAETTTTVASSLSPSAFGQAVTFTAMVSAVSGTPSGSVQFQIDGDNSGSPVPLVNGSASFSTSSLTPGTHTITGIYSGDANFNASTGTVAQTVKTTPPTTTAAPSPSPNTNGWNNTNVVVTLAATDNQGGSGVKDVHFSLNGAQSGSGVVAGSLAQVTITAEGTTTLTYFARDNDGNQEAVKTLIVRVDKTPPELTARCAPGGESPFVAGGDDLSGVDSVTRSGGTTSQKGEFKGEETFTILDRAGNRLEARFGMKAEGREARFTLLSLTYNSGSPITPAANQMKCEFASGKSASVTEVEQKLELKNQGTEVEAKFQAEKNVTRIEVETGGVEQQLSRPGLDLLNLTTNRGQLGFGF